MPRKKKHTQEEIDAQVEELYDIWLNLPDDDDRSFRQWLLEEEYMDPE